MHPCMAGFVFPRYYHQLKNTLAIDLLDVAVLTAEPCIGIGIRIANSCAISRYHIVSRYVIYSAIHRAVLRLTRCVARCKVSSMSRAFRESLEAIILISYPISCDMPPHDTINVVWISRFSTGDTKIHIVSIFFLDTHH